MAKSKAEESSFYEENFGAGNESEGDTGFAEQQPMLPTLRPEILPAHAYPMSMNTRQSRKLAQQADLAIQKEIHTMEIVDTGLSNTAALVRKAKHLMEIAPEGEEEYRYIIQNYAHYVAARARQWGIS